MNDGHERESTPQDQHRTKKPSCWRDYFDWMVRYAQKHVGPNDARAIANEALHDAYRSDRPKPSFDNEQEVRRWLSCLIVWRARAHRKREQRQKAWDLCDIESYADLVRMDVAESSDDVLDRIELMRALQELSSEQRTLVLAYYVGGFSAGELAAKYEKNENTVRTQIARATAKLVHAFRQNKPPAWRAFIFFLEPARLGQSCWDIVDSVRGWLWRSLSAARLVGTCASGVMLGGMMPGDVSDARCVDEKADSLVQGGELLATDRPRASFVVGNDVYAIQDKRVPETRPRVVKAKPLRPEPPSLAKTLAIRKDFEPVDLGASLPDPYDPPKNTEEACSNAYAEAQTAFNLHDDAAVCVWYLNRVPVGIDRCPETDERRRLRKECLAKQVK